MLGRALSRRFLTLFIPLSILIVGGSWLIYSEYAKSRLQIISSQERNVLKQHQLLIDAQIASVITDLKLLAGKSGEVLQSRDEHLRREVERDMLILSRERNSYDQVRLLDASGMEVVRVNNADGLPWAVAAEDLQNKAQRYYFQDTISGQGIYMSPLDLNIEHGRIEVPYKPMIRFGMPIWDDDGQIVGVVIINYLAQQLLARLDEISASGRLVLLNAAGYWLKGLQAEDEWGFMLDERSASRFQYQFMEAWEVINAAERGQELLDGALFSFATIYPLQGEMHSSSGFDLVAGSTTQSLIGRDYYWKLVSFVSPLQLTAVTRSFRTAVGCSAGGLLLLLGLLTLLMARGDSSKLLTEAELSRSEARFRELFNCMRNGVAIYNVEDGREIKFIFQDFNAAAESISTLSKHDVLGRELREVFEPARESELMKVFERVWRTGEAEFAPFVFNREEVDARYIENYVCLLPGGEIICVFDDVTLRTLAEREVAQARETLELRVNERTAELQKINEALRYEVEEHRRLELEKQKVELKLRQSRKMEALGTLAGGIAHDFNNILTSILGYAELAMESGECHSSVTHIYNSGQRAKELVNQILTFTREVEPQKKPLNIAPIVKEVLKMMRATLPSNIEIQQDLDGEAGYVMGDPTQIHQLIMNLVTNAMHAMEGQGGRLAVSLKRAAADRSSSHDGYLVLSVRDSGCGIASENMERIFDPYFTTKDDGTGMGLAVVYGIVDGMGGHVLVQSSPEQGTEFCVYLHAVQSREDAQAERSGGVPVGSERILLVDDEREVIEVSMQQLEQLGYSVTTSTNSVHALELFRTEPDSFDLIITDYMMPKMNGRELASEVHQVRPDIPIVLFSGFSGLVMDEVGDDFCATMDKPFSKQMIARVVRSALDGGAQV